MRCCSPYMVADRSVNEPTSWKLRQDEQETLSARKPATRLDLIEGKPVNRKCALIQFMYRRNVLLLVVLWLFASVQTFVFTYYEARGNESAMLPTIGCKRSYERFTCAASQPTKLLVQRRTTYRSGQSGTACRISTSKARLAISLIEYVRHTDARQPLFLDSGGRYILLRRLLI